MKTSKYLHLRRGELIARAKQNSEDTYLGLPQLYSIIIHQTHYEKSGREHSINSQ